MVALSTPDRRRQVAEAVLQIIASRGTDAVSVREVAAALDVSIGAIQHYFSTKAEMVEFAFGHSVQRVRDRLADLSLTGDPARDLRTVLSELLPLDETRRAEVAINLAFASLATTTPGLQSIQRDLLAGIRKNWPRCSAPDTKARPPCFSARPMAWRCTRSARPVGSMPISLNGRSGWPSTRHCARRG